MCWFVNRQSLVRQRGKWWRQIRRFFWLKSEGFLFLFFLCLYCAEQNNNIPFPATDERRKRNGPEGGRIVARNLWLQHCTHANTPRTTKKTKTEGELHSSTNWRTQMTWHTKENKRENERHRATIWCWRKKKIKRKGNIKGGQILTVKRKKDDTKKNKLSLCNQFKRS